MLFYIVAFNSVLRRVTFWFQARRIGSTSWSYYFLLPDAQISASRRIVRPVVFTLNFWYKCCHVTNCRRFSVDRRTVVTSQSIHWESTSKISVESLRTTSAIIDPFSALSSRCPETSTYYFFDVVHHQVRVVRARSAGSLEYKRQVFPLHRICSKENSLERIRRQWSSRVPPICDQTDSWVTCCVIWFISPLWRSVPTVWTWDIEISRYSELILGTSPK